LVLCAELLNELMALLRQHVRGLPVLRRKLFQANFHTTMSGQAMVSLIYHKKLDDAWKEVRLHSPVTPVVTVIVIPCGRTSVAKRAVA
jgi:hypothetical protein